MRKNTKKAIRMIRVTTIILTAIATVLVIWLLSMVPYYVAKDNMRLAKETANKIGWTDGLVDEYNQAENSIKNSSNLMIRLWYYHNATMKVMLAIVIVVVLLTGGLMLYAEAFLQKMYHHQSRKRRKGC